MNAHSNVMSRWEPSFGYSAYRAAEGKEDKPRLGPIETTEPKEAKAIVKVQVAPIKTAALDETDNLVLIGELDLLAHQMGVCYAEMSPMCRAVALEFGHGLAALRKKLNHG